MAKRVSDGRVSSRSGGARRAEVTFEEHARLAAAMLDVRAGDDAEVEDAMRKIITSAPDRTDVALVLLLAISHAEDRAACIGEATLNGSAGANHLWAAGRQVDNGHFT